MRQANWQKVGGASPPERRSNRTTFLREPCVGSREGAGEASVWGTPSSGVDRLWSARDAAGLAPGGEFEAKRGLESEIGYGFGAFGERGLVTPYAGLGLAEAGNRTWRAGARWSLAPTFAMSLDGTRREAANDNAPEHGVQSRLTVRW